MSKFICKGFVAICCFFSFKSYAQQSEVDLDPVTVTSSLSQKKISSTGRNLLVIKGDQIEKLPVNSIDELLRYLPGLEVQARGPMGAQSDFVIRGSTFQQVLVVLDGIRLNDPLTGHFSSYIPIAPAEIDRIEVLKGASSAIYGSEAVGGVINIITKTFGVKTSTDKKIQAKISRGQYGLLTTDAGAYFTNGKNAFAGGILSNNSRGQDLRGSKGFFYLHTASLSYSHRFNDQLSLAVRSAFDDRNFSAQNYYTTAASDTAEERVRSHWNQIQLQHTKNKSTLNVSVGYKSAEDEYKFNKATASNLNKSKLMQVLAVHQYKFSNSTSLTSGGQFYNRTIRSNDRGNHEEKQAAVFFNLDKKIGGLTLLPALRADWNERSGTELVPQLAFSYPIQKLQLRGSIGKTFRDADFTERFNNYNKPLIPRGQRVGNPDLVAERSLSYEAGADYFLLPSLKISASYFQRLHRKMIDYIATSSAEIARNENLVPNTTYPYAKNVAEVNTKGLEADIQFNKILSGNSSLWSSLGVLWLHSNSSEDQPSFYILSHARFLTNYAVRYTFSRFALSMNGLYKERLPQQAQPIDAKISKSYFLINAKGEVMVWQKRASIYTQIDNLFDEKYSDLLGAIMPQRWVMVVQE